MCVDVDQGISAVIERVQEHRSSSGSVTIALRTVQAADGTRIAFRTVGQGPPLLLIIGYRLSGRSWPSIFVTELAKRFQIILLDNRGTGGSDRPHYGYSMINLARDALTLLEALGIDKAHVLGYSMGGAIAQELACAATHRIDKLVLCNTWSGVLSSIHGGGSSPENWTTPWRMMSQFWSTMRLFQAGRDSSDQSASEAVAMLQIHAMLGFEILPRLRSISAPTLVLAGKEDTVVLPRNSATIASRIPNARLQLMPGLGHCAVWEAPTRMVEIVSEFL